MSITQIAVIDGRQTQKVTLTIEGSGEAFATVINLLGALQWAGSAGHSGKFGCFFDGDGADKITIEGLPDNQGSDMARATCEYGGDYEIFHATSAWCESGVRTEDNPTGVRSTRVYPEQPK